MIPRSHLIFCISLAIVTVSTLLWSTGASPASTQPDATTTITTDGNVNITVDNDGVIHVSALKHPTTASTQPASANIVLRGNTFSNNGRRSHSFDRAVNASDLGQPAPNPLAKLSPEGVTLLKKRGIDIESLQSLKAILIHDELAGSRMRNIVNADPKLLIIFGKGFLTQGAVQSAGPIIATHDAHFMNSLQSDSLIWFVDESTTQGSVVGNPVILAPDLRMSTNRWKCNEIWIGKYGWPDD